MAHIDGKPRHPIHCIVPPHMIEAIKMRGDAKQRKMAIELEKQSVRFREERQDASPPTSYMAAPLVAADVQPQIDREVYDCEQRATLPGKRVRSEGDPSTGDQQVDEAFEGAGHTYRLYLEEYKRNSIDGNGMKLVSSVHYRRKYNNAFWNGSQMAYGDGDGVIFKALTGDLPVIGHELSHGVVQFSGGLVYRDQSGALNEHFADVFGVLTQQYKNNQEVHEADWLIGADIFTPDIDGDALRSMAAPGTAYDDDLIGKDPQPYHMDDYVQTQSDNGGVHINSGIPNHAFYLVALMLGGKAWTKAGHIWYHTLQTINNPHARFADWADETINQARTLFGARSREAILTRRAWKLVGVF
jgi:Zn-dependent metalloprotease